MAARWEVGVDRTYLFRRYEGKQNKREEKNIRIGITKQEIGVRKFAEYSEFPVSSFACFPPNLLRTNFVSQLCMHVCVNLNNQSCTAYVIL